MVPSTSLKTRPRLSAVSGCPEWTGLLRPPKPAVQAPPEKPGGGGRERQDREKGGQDGDASASTAAASVSSLCPDDVPQETCCRDREPTHTHNHE